MNKAWIFKGHAKKLNNGRPTPSLELAKKVGLGGLCFIIFLNESETSFVFNGKECCDQLLMPVFGTEWKHIYQTFAILDPDIPWFSL